MAIDICEEEVITFSQARKLIPARRSSGKRTDVTCFYRWAKSGCKGIRLEVIQIGGTTCTSKEALQRFFDRLTAATQGQSVTPAARQRQIDAAERELDAAGI